MDYREALCTQIDLYFNDIVKPYHDVTVPAMKAAKKLKLFRKTDFTGYIADFEKLKEKALRLESMDIPVPETDIDAKLLAKDFRNSLLSFIMLCDSNIVFYDWNQRKQYPDSGVTIKGYNDVVNDMKKALAEAVMDLDFLERTYKKYQGQKSETEA
ncbi:MAG: hypothetical protein IKU44_02930 [Firmicutes bacterium]|nr:hypothetical protein [Bacillota bacterium]